jgi:arylsulfate sulfotransferase
MVDRGTRFTTLGLVLLFISTLFGCGSSNSPLTISPTSAVLLPGQSAQFVASSGAFSSTSEPWQVNGVQGGSASTGTISQAGIYTAPSSAPGQPVLISVRGFSGQAGVRIFDPTNLQPSNISTTNNTLVAAYAVTVPAAASVRVQFGPDTSYGLSTSPVQAPPGGGTTTVLVAGMRASSTYHMQAVINLVNGSHVLDSDHTFTTGSIPANLLPELTATTNSPAALSPGVELLSLDPQANTTAYGAVATDLGGNVIWYYDLGGGAWPFPIKPLDNGHMLVLATPLNSLDSNEIREIDLAGNVINTIGIAQVNTTLAGVADFQIASFHHDVLHLPNGHYILLCDYSKTFNNTPGLPNGTVVAGDALVDWDPVQNTAVWTWSTFEHLDPTRIPYGIVNGVADWTHSNAIIYSPEDGNLIMSLRNQNWVIKINYQNGTGDGSILWKLGYQGDFTLAGNQAPIEFNYGQHYPTVVSQNSAGVFSLMFFNNGNERRVNSNDDPCSTPGTVNCYSSIPIFQLNESTMTGNVTWEDNLAPAYSICCGDTQILPNGDLEYDIAYNILTPGYSHIQEVSQTDPSQILWNMEIKGQLAYRGLRIPSLYPGVTWPAMTDVSPATKARATSTGKPAPFSVEKIP